MLDDNFLVVYEEIMRRKANFIELENLDYMKLLMCLKFGDIFNLSKVEKKCSCGETKGMYVDDINAIVSGDCQPIGFANSSFIQSIKLQRLEDGKPKRKEECCKGVEFKAFLIPKSATSITRD